MKKLLLNSTSIAIYTSLIIILFRLVSDTFNWNGPERVYAPMFGVVISAFLGDKTSAMLLANFLAAG